jgi:murein DD-endopeptidase MepM/ murein hydrolase activator NlpD
MHALRYAALLLTLSAPAAAKPGDMIPVKNSPMACENDGCPYHEWRFDGLPGVHFGVLAYEDGFDARFYLVGANRAYMPLLDVIPLARDSKGAHRWGYIENLKSLPAERTNEPITGEGKSLPFKWDGTNLRVWATFDHDLVEDGVHCHPQTQKRLPIVRFDGEPGHGDALAKSYPWQRVSLMKLAADAATGDPKALPLLSMCNENGGRPHYGVDFITTAGKPVKAMAAGRVVAVRSVDVGDLGRLVAVKHPDGVTSLLGHLATVTVKPGQDLSVGDVLGTAGFSGAVRRDAPVLHMEILSKDIATADGGFDFRKSRLPTLDPQVWLEKPVPDKR